MVWGYPSFTFVFIDMKSEAGRKYKPASGGHKVLYSLYRPQTQINMWVASQKASNLCQTWKSSPGCTFHVQTGLCLPVWFIIAVTSTANEGSASDSAAESSWMFSSSSSQVYFGPFQPDQACGYLRERLVIQLTAAIVSSIITKLFSYPTRSTKMSNRAVSWTLQISWEITKLLQTW